MWSMVHLGPIAALLMQPTPPQPPNAAGRDTRGIPPPMSILDWPAALDAPISTDRPDFTESPNVLPVGRGQIELGYTFSDDRRAGARATDHTFPELLFRFGIAPQTELRIGWVGYSLTTHQFSETDDEGRTRYRRTTDEGASDVSIGIKLRVLDQQAAIPDFSIIAGLSAPSGSLSQTASDVVPEIKLLWAYELTEQIAVAGNVNFAVPVYADEDDAHNRRLETAASFSLSYELTDWLGSYAEYFGIFSGFADDEQYLNGGFTIPVGDDAQIDLRAGTGLNDAADDFFCGVGFAFRF